jgi:hypothetical protein
MSDTKKVGENADQKITRLLLKLNVTLIEEGSGDEIELRRKKDGSGVLVLITAEFPDERKFYSFRSTEELLEFLEAGQLKRILLVSCNID